MTAPGPLTAPGIYDAIPDAVYHGQLTDTPSISASGLIQIEQTCPARWWHASYLNPAREPAEDTPALLFGRAAHKLILEGRAAFDAAFAIRPDDYDGRSKEGKAWLAENAGRTILTADQGARAIAMAAAIRSNPRCNAALSDGKPEQTIVWRDAETGIWLKARPDWLPSRRRLAINYKTTESIRIDAWSRSVETYGYHQAAALMLDGLRNVLGWDDAVACFPAQEKAAPHLAEVFVLGDDWIEAGRDLNRKAIRTFAACVERNEWPGYYDAVQTVERPAWARVQFEKRVERGEFSEQQKEKAA